VHFSLICARFTADRSPCSDVLLRHVRLHSEKDNILPPSSQRRGVGVSVSTRHAHAHRDSDDDAVELLCTLGQERRAAPAESTAMEPPINYAPSAHPHSGSSSGPVPSQTAPVSAFPFPFPEPQPFFSLGQDTPSPLSGRTAPPPPPRPSDPTLWHQFHEHAPAFIDYAAIINSAPVEHSVAGPPSDDIMAAWLTRPDRSNLYRSAPPSRSPTWTSAAAARKVDPLTANRLWKLLQTGVVRVAAHLRGPAIADES
jgi:hypothetical protein